MRFGVFLPISGRAAGPATLVEAAHQAETMGYDSVWAADRIPIEVTREPAPQEEDRLRGTPEQLAKALRHFRAIGVEHLALQFMVPRWPERRAQIERFAREVMPLLADGR